MDDRNTTHQYAITQTELASRIGAPDQPLIIDVRRGPAFADDLRMIAGAIRREHDAVGNWAGSLPKHRDVVVYCVHGHEVGQNAAADLRARGIAARFLEGGVEDWKASGHPSFAKSPIYDGTAPTRWVTRERPKIDRLACPWLIRRFIDPLAEIIYVPSERVIDEAQVRQAQPFDIPGATFSHVGEDCSFDAFIRQFDLKAPGLGRLAQIVRGADTSRLDLSAQSAGLYAISLGFSGTIGDDQALLAQGIILYDALYHWCRDLQSETHSWPPRMTA